MFTVNTSINVIILNNVIGVNMENNTNLKNYHHGDLKKTLLLTSIQILKEEGYRSLSLRYVAKKAGVSQTAPYRHFKDLESLLVCIAIDGFSQLKKQLEQIRERYQNLPLLQFRESGIAYIEFALENPDLFQIMYGNQIQDHSKYTDLIQSEKLTFQTLVKIIKECQNSKLIRILNAEKAALSAWTMVHGIAMLIIGKQLLFYSNQKIKTKKITKELMQFLYDGLKL